MSKKTYNLKSNSVSIIYDEVDGSRIGRIFAVNFGKQTMYVAKSKNHCLPTAYKTIEGAALAFGKVIGRSVQYS